MAIRSESKRGSKTRAKKKAGKKVAKNKVAKKLKKTLKKTAKKRAKKQATKKATKKKSTRKSTVKTRAKASARKKRAPVSRDKRPISVMRLFPKRIGTVSHYYAQSQAAIVRLDSGALHVGDAIHIRGHTTDFYERVEELKVDDRTVDAARAGQSVGIRLTRTVRENDGVYLLSE